jgi:hypothetical protein
MGAPPVPAPAFRDRLPRLPSATAPAVDHGKHRVKYGVSEPEPASFAMINTG